MQLNELSHSASTSLPSKHGKSLKRLLIDATYMGWDVDIELGIFPWKTLSVRPCMACLDTPSSPYIVLK